MKPTEFDHCTEAIMAACAAVQARVDGTSKYEDEDPLVLICRALRHLDAVRQRSR